MAYTKKYNARRTPYTRRKRTNNYKRKRPYARKSKKAMVSRRSPIVETKSLDFFTTTTDLVNNGFVTFLPKTYTQLENGTSEHNMIGRSIFSKYLTCKTQLSTALALGGTTDVTIESIHGWCKVPMALTPNTAETPADISYGDLVSHVENQLEPLLNQGGISSQMNFFEKQEGIKIISRKPYHRKEDFTIESASSGVMKNADIFRTFQWKPMKKITYELGVKNTDMAQSNTHYPNRDWIPFVAFLTTGTFVADKEPFVQFNEKHWFSDS